MDIATLLAFAVRNQASDLHLCAGLAPLLRVHGAIRRINLQPLDGAHLQQSLLAVMPAPLQPHYRAGTDCDFALALPGLGRFRIHAFHQQRGPAAAIRPLGQQPPALAELHAPPACAELATRPHGLEIGRAHV